MTGKYKQKICGFLNFKADNNVCMSNNNHRLSSLVTITGLDIHVGSHQSDKVLVKLTILCIKVG